MSDLIREYEDFIDELRADYLSRGFRIIPADETSSKLGFQPDLVVAQDGEVTVIEVKSTDRAPPARINDLRKRVERLGYRFELKVVPRAPKKRTGPEHTTRVPQLLSDAEEFFKADRLDLALLLSWIALGISIRVLDARMTDAQEPVTSTGDLVRTATDLELISEEELPDVRAIAELRNRVVHGFETEVPRRLVAQAVELARRIEGGQIDRHMGFLRKSAAQFEVTASAAFLPALPQDDFGLARKPSLNSSARFARSSDMLPYSSNPGVQDLSA